MRGTAPLAAVEASAAAAAEAAAELLLNTAALAADTLAAVLSPTDFAAEVVTRATASAMAATATERHGDEAGPDRLHRPTPTEQSR